MFSLFGRPDVEGPPTEVEVNLYVRSMGPVDEGKNIFTLDIYFRQYWTDRRDLSSISEHVLR